MVWYMTRSELMRLFLCLESYLSGWNKTINKTRLDTFATALTWWTLIVAVFSSKALILDSSASRCRTSSRFSWTWLHNTSKPTITHLWQYDNILCRSHPKTAYVWQMAITSMDILFYHTKGVTHWNSSSNCCKSHRNTIRLY